MIATRRFARLVLLAALVLPMAAFAKRIPAPVIEPVVHEGVRYTVPNDRGTVGYVVASDVATGKQLWKKTVFRKCICPFFEHDVQWVFIRQMRLDGERLIFVSERDKSYALDLKTRRVKKLKQQRRAKRGPNIPKECRQPGAGRTGLFAFPGWTKPRRPAREVEGRGLMRKVSVRIGDEGRG